METKNQENVETVASAQPFLSAEKEQMEKLTESAKELGRETAEAAKLPPEIQARLDKLDALEAVEKQEEVESVIEESKEEVEVSPEIQARLDRLEEVEKAEKEKREDEEKDPDYVKFNKPYHFEGKEYKGIKLEFDEMTGADILEAEEEFIATKTQTAAQTPLKELSKGYLAFFAARACAQPVDFVLGLDGKSFAKITRKAQSFLLSED